MTAETFGPYRIEAPVGRGGMGEVHRATDTRKDRLVALKRLPTELASDERFQARFRREAATIARLTEPHIIPVHDYGEIEGRLFLDMRLVAGPDLADLLRRETRLSPTRAVGLVAQVAAALDAAHADNGLLHRDVKPSNILFAAPGGDFVYLIDFGIAHGARQTRLTASGSTVGTLSYMAPERFTSSGENAEDPSVDVYSLGCVLYEVLTGAKPYPGTDAARLVAAHLHAPPPRPSERRPDLPTGLDAVVGRALAKEPGRRYASAGELASAAQDALAVAPAPRRAAPSARPVHAPVRYVLATAGPGAAAPPVAPGPTSQPPMSQPPTSQPPTSTPPLPAPASQPPISQPPISQPPTVGPPTVGPPISPPPGSQPPGSQQPPAPMYRPRVSWPPDTAPTVPTGPRWWRSRGGRALLAAGAVVVVLGAVVTGIGVSGPGETGTVTPPEVPPARAVATALPVPIYFAKDGAVSRDGRSVYVANQDRDGIPGNVTVVDTATGSVRATLNLGNSPMSTAVSPDGRRAYVTQLHGPDPRFGGLTVLDTATNAVVGTVGVGTTPFGITVSPDGSRVYVANNGTEQAPSGTVSIVDASALRVLSTVPFADAPFSVEPAPDGRHVYVANKGVGSYSSQTLGVIDTRTGTASTIPVAWGPTDTAVSPDGRFVYVTGGAAAGPASPGGTLSVVDTRTNLVTPILVPGLNNPESAVLTPDGRRLLIANTGTDQQPGATVTVVDTATRTVVEDVAVLNRPGGLVMAPDGHHVFVIGDRLWRIDLP